MTFAIGGSINAAFQNCIWVETVSPRPKSSESWVGENLNIIIEEGGRFRRSGLQTFNLRTDSLDTSRWWESRQQFNHHTAEVCMCQLHVWLFKIHKIFSMGFNWLNSIIWLIWFQKSVSIVLNIWRHFLTWTTYFSLKTVCPLCQALACAIHSHHFTELYLIDHGRSVPEMP